MRRRERMKVAITGGIGSGKSYVCGLLKSLGIEVYDCDSAAKRIMRHSARVRKELTELIGQDAYVGNVPNKPCLASYILASEENARRVNHIVHPAVAEDFKMSGYDFMECAILFTSGFNKLVDKIICVTAPFEIRVQRIMARDGISKDRAEEWIRCQMSQDEMASRSDYLVENDGEAEVVNVLRDILEDIYKK